MISLFKDPTLEQEYYRCYDKTLNEFGLPFESRFVPTTFGETHVLRFGEEGKKPLVLLHGMTMSSAMWYPNVKPFAQDRTVYAIDVMGDFGKSRPAAPLKSRQEAARWLLETLDALKLDKADLAGHSMGGFLALNFSLSCPERVSKLVLYAPAGSFHKINLKFFAKIFPALIFHSERLTDKAFIWLSGNKEPLEPAIRSLIVAAYRGAMPQLHVVPSVIPPEEFRGFAVPTLLVVGEKEVIYPAGKVAETAKSLIADLETRVIPGASHSLTIEHAGIVNEATLRFLRK